VVKSLHCGRTTSLEPTNAASPTAAFAAQLDHYVANP